MCKDFFQLGNYYFSNFKFNDNCHYFLWANLEKYLRRFCKKSDQSDTSDRKQFKHKERERICMKTLQTLAVVQ